MWPTICGRQKYVVGDKADTTKANGTCVCKCLKHSTVYFLGIVGMENSRFFFWIFVFKMFFKLLISEHTLIMGMRAEEINSVGSTGCSKMRH
jgi:hypothetical protein